MDKTPLTSQQEEALLNSFLGMVHAEDGDFDALAPLGRACADTPSLDLVLQDLLELPFIKMAIEERLTIGPFDFDKLKTLPEQSLGYVYARHMESNNLSPITPKPCTTVLEYLNFHISETHDIWHVVTDSPTDVLGEIQLEAFYVAQLKYSRFWLALLAKNLLKATVFDIESAVPYMERIVRGWQMGCAAQSLFGIPWNTLWHRPISEIRADLNINLLL